ncbi:MAG: 2-dehydropantoate 2-reductase, partial [Acidimicrobiales bacterium]
MKFVVAGAGAIGAFVGACLARGGADVTLVARGAHLQAMREGGVRVHSVDGDFVSHPEVTDDFEAVADAGVVFVGLKAYSLPELAPQIGPHLRPATGVVWAQNGIPWWYFQAEGGPLDGTRLESTDPGGAISDAFASAHNIGCVAYSSAEIVEPGVIRHVEGTRFIIGEPDGSDSERCQEISKVFASGGLKAPVEARIRNQIWLKL